MTATLTCYNVGTADSSLIELVSGWKVLIDYANYNPDSDPSESRINLEVELRNNLRKDGRKGFNVVAFTHLDDDHIHGFSDAFWLDHAKAYQDNDRFKIDELWVPAAAITEEGLKGEARILRAEARHRLKQGKGIRVFSRPEHLKAWLESEGLTLESRRHLITDAGQTVPGFTLTGNHQVEFFIHSPFAWRQDESTLIDRNECSLCFQAVFQEGAQQTKVLFMADTTHEMLNEMVIVTRDRHKRPERLEWDIYKSPHHSSYLSVGPDKGVDETKPIPNVKWLLETQRRASCLIISSCDAIPLKGTAEDEDAYPPHRQAHNYYKKTAAGGDGEVRVTMEFPNKIKPKPTIVTINSWGATLSKSTPAAAAAIAAAAPRAGCK
ncbi:hypothetical protein [Ferrovibrio sp.]|uniref:hypothetical protein n=1 Tax=Ferrovibrio sp. TaxID=1917215 RepID=UPI003519B42F